MRNISARSFAFLRDEIDAWRENGLISAGQADAIERFYVVRRRSFAQILLSAGALLVGLGVICAVAANWDDIPRAVRMTLIISAYLGTMSTSCLVQKSSPRTSRALLLLAALIFGGGIFLTAQMYHHGGHWSSAFGWWAAGLLPGVWLLRDDALFTLMQTVTGFYLAGVELTASGVWATSSPHGAAYHIWPVALLFALWTIWARSERPREAFHANMLLTLGTLFLRIWRFYELPDALLAFFALGLAMQFIRPLSDWGALVFGLCGLALSVPEVWHGGNLWAALMPLDSDAIEQPTQVLAAAASVLTALVMAVRLRRGARLGGAFLTLLVVRYFVDHFFAFTSKAVAFSALGALCLLAGLFWERRHRRGGDEDE